MARAAEGRVDDIDGVVAEDVFVDPVTQLWW